MNSATKTSKPRNIDNQIRRSEARILSAKNGATQILTTIRSWPESEMPKGRNRRMKILEKVLKQIREPKYGVSLMTLGLVFCRNRCPREPKTLANDDPEEFTYESMKTARGLVRRLRKSEPEGLNIAIFKYKDPVLGITEYRYVNTFWNDSLTEDDILNQLEHAKKCRDGWEKRQKQLQYSADHSDEVRAAADKLVAEIFEGTEAEDKKQLQRNPKVVDDGKNNKLDYYTNMDKE